MLSSESKPYREALTGLRETLGPDENLSILTAGEDAAGETVVAFGAKAAASKHSSARTLIVALAPAYTSDKRDEACVLVISAMPAPEAMVVALRRLQPKLSRIWVPWISPSFGPYLNDLVKAGRAAGIAVEATRLAKSEELPTRLRAREAEPTAILVPPDPELISRNNFDILKQAARAKKLPLYAPFPSLVAEGATASIGLTFYEMGRAAGIAALKPRGSQSCGATSYPERLSIMVSLSAAAESGLPNDPGHFAGHAETVP